MTTLPLVALPALLLFTATPAFADCHWAWHCDPSAGCGYVPFCDSPTDKPPPLQGTLPPPSARNKPRPPPDAAHPARQPLPGYKPVNPPPPGVRPAQPTEGDKKKCN